MMKGICLVALVLVPAQSFVLQPSVGSSATRLNLYDKVEGAISEAQAACDLNGPMSQECRVAWDVVEELEAADSHKAPTMGSAELDVNDAVAPMLFGYSTLLQKSDLKMGQLKAVTDQLLQYGVEDPAMTRVNELALEMQMVLSQGRESLSQYYG